MQQQAYDFIRGLIDVVMVTWPIGGPILLLYAVISFVDWARGQARGSSEVPSNESGASWERWRR